MNNPHYFIEESLKKGFEIYLEGQNINHANSISTITPIYPGVGFETSYIKKVLKEMATIYARLINQCKFQYHIFQLAFIRLMKNIKEVMKLNYLLIWVLIII